MHPPAKLVQFTPQNMKRQLASLPDSLTAWTEAYLNLAVIGVRAESSVAKVRLQLERFVAFFQDRYGHDKISTLLPRDIAAWQQHLLDVGVPNQRAGKVQPLARKSVNNYLAGLSGFCRWVDSQSPALFPQGNPMKGVKELGTAAPKVRALSKRQVASLKSVADRLHVYYRLKGRRGQKAGEWPSLKVHARPLRDRAIIFTFLSTGLRREELVNLNLDQLEPHDLDKLRQAKMAKLVRVEGKNKSEREVFLSLDARQALADYLEQERPRDVTASATALFLSAAGLPARKEDGRLGKDAVNDICLKIGRLHDAEVTDPARHISPLRPHDLRHTFAVHLAKELTQQGQDVRYELERRLGHRSDQYLALYTNPPEDVAASYVEDL